MSIKTRVKRLEASAHADGVRYIIRNAPNGETETGQPMTVEAWKAKYCGPIAEKKPCD